MKQVMAPATATVVRKQVARMQEAKNRTEELINDGDDEITVAEHRKSESIDDGDNEITVTEHRNDESVDGGDDVISAAGSLRDDDVGKIEKKMVKKSKKTESTPKSKIEKRKCKQVEEIAYESNKKLKENPVKELESSNGSNKRLKVISKTNGEDLEISRKNTDIIEQPKKRKRIQKPVEFVVKCRSTTLVHIINNLTVDQKQAVKKIGFGGLLEIKVTEFPKGILKWVIQAFNHNSFLFKASTTKEFILSKDDIHDFFMLPREGRRLEFTPIGRSKAAVEEPLKEEWRKRFRLGGTTEMIKISQLSQRIKDTVDSGDEFKRLFVLYTMSTFLAPTSNHNLDFKLLNAVQDVAEIRNFNWCQYIFDELVKAVADFKGGCKFFCGCTIFLVLAYLHRIEFREEVQPTELPLIKHWTDAKLKKRVDDEKVVGYLGDGCLTKTNYPICLQKHEPVTEESRKEDGRRGTVFESGKIYALMELYPGIESDEQLKKRAIDDIHLLFLEMKRDSDLFHARNVERMKIFKQKVGSGPDIHEKSKESSSTPVALSPTQQYYKNPIYHAYMDELVKRSKHAKSLDIPSFEEFEELIHAYNKALDEEQHNSAKENESQGNNVDSLDDIVINIANDVVKTTAKEKRTLNKRRKSIKDKNLEALRSSKSTRRRSLRDIAKHGIPNDETTVSRQRSDGEQAEDEDSEAIQDETTDMNKYLLHTNSKEHCMIIVHDNIGCLLDCGEPNDDIVLLPEYMIENKELMRPVLQLRKEEQLIGILTAEDDKREGYVDEIFKAWKGWETCYKSTLNLDVEMIFIPLLLYKHFFCACINFKDKKIDYLDNREYEGVFKDNEFVSTAKITADIFGRYLTENGVKKGEMVNRFEIRNVPFNWQCKELFDNLDCGVFMMLHMLFYVGKLFNCGLGNATSRIVYRAEILAILVMSELNSTGQELLDKVEKIRNQREALLPLLVEQRRKSAEDGTKKKGVEDEDAWSTPAGKQQNNYDDCVKTPKSVLGSRVNGTSDGIGCTLYCGEAAPKSLVVSRFMRSNQSLFSLILSTRKEVADYCFLDDYIFDQSECLVVYNGTRSLTREDIQTMLPTEEVAALVEREAHGTQVDTQANNVYECWNKFVEENSVHCNLEAELIFIPLYAGRHYFCICVNMTEEIIEVLDNQIHKSWKDSTVYNIARVVSGILSDYLEMKGRKDADKLTKFTINETMLPWRTADANDEESGCFLMMHMIA
ncbi:hypothetical protein RND81_03G100500 [Saponaria officinalis]|uniref:Ubiquitin-like protease family profile domain-containing protein n=1 Tax=Saponaria officinalis TaxID=3572 RepID=A0AAW1M537_SAPOF